MPRDGQGVYQLPPGSVAVTGETILASTHNVPLDDLEADANDPRPIVAGGTGEENPRDAIEALGGASFDSTRTITSNETILETDNNALIKVDATAGDVVVTLPEASTLGDKFRVLIKRIDGSSNNVTIERSGSDVIDGEVSKSQSIKFQFSEFHCDGAGWNVTGGGIPVVPDVIIQHQRPSGTDGGTFTSGSWQRMQLNTIVRNHNNTLASLVSSVMTLQPGTYYVQASVTARAVDRFKLRLRNTTDNITEVVGTSEFASFANLGQNTSSLIGIFSIDGPNQSALALEGQCDTTILGNGLGEASSFGEIEIYGTISLTKIVALRF